MYHGRFELFNFRIFDDESQNRRGSDKDVKDLDDCIKKCLPQSRVTKNPSSLTSKYLTLRLQRIASSDFTNVNYLLCFFSSHGDGRSILTSDLEDYPLSKIIGHFNCDALKGIPKIFVVQSCRGREYDDGYDADMKPEVTNIGALVSDQKDLSSIDAVAPLELSPKHPKLLAIENARACANMSLRALQEMMPEGCVVAFSTPPNRYSWRSTYKGGHYVQSLIQILTEFHKSGREMDVTRILTATNERIATQFSSQAVTAWGKKQIGEFVSTLTKKLVL